MSTLLSAQSVGYDNNFGPLLVEVSFSLKKGDRIGLIGHNGCGKSTLLKILSGDLPAGSGSVTPAHQCLMARVEQHLPETLHGCTLLEAVLARLPENQRVSESWQGEVLLARLGFAPASWTLTAGTLSGGQHTRLLLARALIRQPDLLLLDEPSNHLDLPTLLWLERFLQNWSGSFVLVSHDRYLLDQVTNCTWILRDKTLQFFRLPCTAARQALEEQDAADAHRRQAEQKEIDRVAKSAQRLAIWGKVYDNEDLARKAKQMEKRVDRLKEEQTTLSAGSQWRLRLKGKPWMPIVYWLCHHWQCARRSMHRCCSVSIHCGSKAGTASPSSGVTAAVNHRCCSICGGNTRTRPCGKRFSIRGYALGITIKVCNSCMTTTR